MQTKVLIMRPDDQSNETREYDLPRAPGYEALRKIIAPILERGALEHVSVWADFGGGTKYKALDMFVDDCGLLKNLPRNEAATVIYRRANQVGKSNQPKADDPEDLSFICGTAILFSRRVWF